MQGLSRENQKQNIRLKTSFFKDSGKILCWSIVSVINCACYLYFISDGSEYIWTKVELLSLFSSVWLLVVFFHLYILGIFDCIIGKPISQERKKQYNKTLYSLAVFMFFILPIWHIFFNPYYGLMLFFTCSLAFSFFNSLFSGLNDFDLSKKIYITELETISFGSILNNRSDYSRNYPDKLMLARQSFFKIIICGSICLESGLYYIYRDESPKVSLRQILISIDLTSSLNIFNSEYNYGPAKKDIDIDKTVNNKVILSLVCSRDNLKNKKDEKLAEYCNKYESYVENYSNEKKKIIDFLYDSSEVSLQQSRSMASYDGYKKQYFNPLFFKVLISLILGLLLSYFWKTKAFADDYIDKWKILNSQLLIIFEKNNSVGLTNLKLKFCLDLIELKMWGHKTFSNFFQSYLVENFPEYSNESFLIIDQEYIKEKLYKKLLQN